MLMLAKQSPHKLFVRECAHVVACLYMQEVKELLLQGKVPPDSKACLDKFLANK